MELQRNTHHVYRLMYHFFWIPEYRHKVFDEPYREAMKAIIRSIATTVIGILRTYNVQNALVNKLLGQIKIYIRIFKLELTVTCLTKPH
ncbi:MAG: hypothetical protein ACI9LE_000341 [Paraglaciecola sp.]|jgi:hypothetical protein